jgi:hypothetical protein
MKGKQKEIRRLKAGIILMFLVLSIHGQPFSTDTLWIQHTDASPVIDGNPSDPCWESASWEPINQVWIQWGEPIDSADFYGRYKVLWSSAQNLIYVLTEITDDVFVDGYVYHSDPQNNNYPDYDVLEVFLDENASKGKHVFDGTGQTGIDWGTNAENAFSYHIMAGKPGEGDTVTDIDVCDIAGTSWADEWIVNYKAHLPEFALSRNENQYIWEFSLKVYDEEYDPNNPLEDNRITLVPLKIMGLSFAYCDNDEAGTTRDNFIGSVWVPEERYNDHWMDAGDFRAARLAAGSMPTGFATREELVPYIIYNPESRRAYFIPASASGRISVFNMQGILLRSMEWQPISQHESFELPFEDQPDGIYVITSVSNGQSHVTKISVY